MGSPGIPQEGHAKGGYYQRFAVADTITVLLFVPVIRGSLRPSIRVYHLFEIRVSSVGFRVQVFAQKKKGIPGP